MACVPSWSRPRHAPDRKSVLFCPVCGHESPADGDWIVRSTGPASGGRQPVECPECGTIITERLADEAVRA